MEEHVTSAHHRSTAGAGGSGGEKPKKREFTAKQMEIVKRVKTCKHHEYYAILSGELPDFCMGVKVGSSLTDVGFQWKRRARRTM